jgi:outer membrane protein assembly factor BamB
MASHDDVTAAAAAVTDYANPQDQPAARARVWPAAALVLAFWAVFIGLRIGGVPMFRQFLGQVGALLILLLSFTIWWAVDARGRRGERLIAILALVGGAILAILLASKTFQGPQLIMSALPWVFTAWALWAILARRADPKLRRRGLVVAILLAWCPFLLLRTEGLRGDGGAEFRWRWSPTAEDRYLAQLHNLTASGTRPATQMAPVVASQGDWPAFRGPDRDGVVRGVRIATDWAANPPKLCWKEPVGPGWSSMSVVGGRVFTQEQRDQSEAVVCRDADTGRELWAHTDAGRFWDSLSGAGPRATPTFADGRLYTLGATGLLNCLDPASGARIWSRDIAADSGAKMPIWGFASSPLVTHGLVIVFAGGEGKGLLAYNARTGQPAWTAPAGKHCYSSAQLAVLGGEEQVLFWDDRGLLAVDPATGKPRWELAISGASAMPRSVQPHVIAGTRVAVASDVETTVVEPHRQGDQWTSADRPWTSSAFRPSFNDFVLHDGAFLYGLDGGNLVCIDANDGHRRWRKGRYGAGQLLLLADQSLLLVLCESGDLALVAAKPDAHHELARIPDAITGKTWNHPAIAQGRLYIRNGQEMACFALPLAR